jgi:hypothetical protein
MPSLDYEAARAEAERTHAICAAWTEAHGLSIWREGHPSDRQKLRERRNARRILAIEQGRLLANPEGRA